MTDSVTWNVFNATFLASDIDERMIVQRKRIRVDPRTLGMTYQ